MRLSKDRLIALVGILALTILQPVSIWGVTIRDDEPDSSYLALGASQEYAPVGTFASNGPYSGSGVLIAPDWVLVSAHEVYFASSGTFTINGSSYASTQLIGNPGWTGNALNGYDFGLVHLSSAVVGVTPATLYTGSSDVGQIGTFVGYGLTGTGLTGFQVPADFQKRAFQNVIDGDFSNPSILLGCDFDSPHTSAYNYFGDATPLTLEGCVAPGDSGGGVFITIDSQTYLEGIISFVQATAATGGNGNSVYGDLSGFGRVSAFVPWIDSIISVPEPPTFALLAGAGSVLLLALFSRVNPHHRAINMRLKVKSSRGGQRIG